MSDETHRKMIVMDIVAAMETIAPQELAEPWDRVGLQVGDPGQQVESVLLTLDVTPEAIRLATEAGSTLIICHHPVIFSPPETLRRDDPAQALLMDLVGRQISVLAAHTNLDAAACGIADALADCLTRHLPADTGSGEVKNLGPVATYGRLIATGEPVLLSDIGGICLSRLGASGCFFNTDRDRPVRRIAAFPGSFAEEGISAVRAAGADCVLCGESKHSTGLALSFSDIAQICFGHDVSERVVLLPLADRLRAFFPDISFAVYQGLVYNDIAFRVSRTAAGVNRKAAREESPGSKGQGAG